MPFRLDRDQNGGAIMIFIRENMTVKFLLMNKPNESLEIEISLR